MAHDSQDSQTDQAGDRVTASQRLPALGTGIMGVLYALMLVGVLEVQGHDTARDGVFIAGAGSFLVLAVVLWVWRRQAVRLAAVVVHLLAAALYVVTSTQRDPAFEIWGLTERALSAVVLVLLFVQIVRHRSSTRQ